MPPINRATPTAPPARSAFGGPIIVKPQPAAPQAEAKPQSDDKQGVFQQVQGAVRWAILGPTAKEFKTREVVREASTTYADRPTTQAAVANIQSSQAREQAAIDKLGARAGDYRKLAAICDKTPMARNALLTMLLDGRLAKQDLANKGDLLTYLARMSNQPLAGGVDRTALITNLVQEVADPVSISQQAKGTCAATTATVVLVRKSPAEYARLVSDLATPAGQATTIDGHVLKRNPDWNDSGDGGRTPSMRLLEPALMQLGGLVNGVMHYDNDKDAYTLASDNGMVAGLRQSWDAAKAWAVGAKGHVTLPGGLETLGTNRVLEALTGDKYQIIYLVTRANRDWTWDRVGKALAAGKSVPCGMAWEGGGHEILLDKIENGYAYFNNPWGETDRMSVDEFKANLGGVNLPR